MYMICANVFLFYFFFVNVEVIFLFNVHNFVVWLLGQLISKLLCLQMCGALTTPDGYQVRRDILKCVH